MKHKYKDIEGSRREFAVEVPPEEVQKRLDYVYGEMMKVAQIPGFRTGKAPRHLVEKYHSKEAKERVLGDIISDSYRQAVAESDTAPVGLPAISDVACGDGEAFTFKATVDIRPKVQIRDYRNIRVNKKKVGVKEEEITRYIEALRESYAQFKPVEGRPSKLGDYLICDILCEVDGKPVYKEQKNIFLPLDKGHSLPEVIDGLAGAMEGESKVISATLPAGGERPEYAGRKALFKIKVHSIKEKTTPDLNDEFVKSLGSFENLDQLKDAVKTDLLRKKENMVKNDISNQILERFLTENRFDAPRGLVGEETQRILKEAGKEKENGEFRKKTGEKAENNVRLFFILDEIAKAENITVTEKDLDDTLDLLARQSNTAKENVKKYYEDNDIAGSLRQQIKENKVIEFLISKAEIRETA